MSPDSIDLPGNRYKLTLALLAVLTTIAVGLVLKAAQAVVLPLIIAWLLSYILGPVVTALTRRRVPAGLAVALMLLLLMGVFYLTAVFLHARMSAFVLAYPRYESRLSDLAATVSGRWRLSYDPLAGIQWGDRIGKFLVQMSGSLVNFVSNLVMVAIFLVFMLLGKPYFPGKIRRALRQDQAETVDTVLRSISNQVGRFLGLQCVISAVTGVLVWAALELIGVDFAVTWGAAAFFLNFVPTVGSILASIPPVILALIQFYPNYWPCVATLIALLGIQMTIGNVIAPKLFGDKLNLSPVVVLLSLVFWGWLWGIVGALLAVPLAAIIKIVCENVEPLHPIGILMGSGKIYRGDAGPGEHDERKSAT